MQLGAVPARLRCVSAHPNIISSMAAKFFRNIFVSSPDEDSDLEELENHSLSDNEGGRSVHSESSSPKMDTQRQSTSAVKRGSARGKKSRVLTDQEEGESEVESEERGSPLRKKPKPTGSPPSKGKESPSAAPRRWVSVTVLFFPWMLLSPCISFPFPL